MNHGKYDLKTSFVAQDNFLPVREFYACMPRTKYMQHWHSSLGTSISGTLVNDFSRFLARPLRTKYVLIIKLLNASSYTEILHCQDLIQTSFFRLQSLKMLCTLKEDYVCATFIFTRFILFSTNDYNAKANISFVGRSVEQTKNKTKKQKQKRHQKVKKNNNSEKLLLRNQLSCKIK